MFWVVSIEKVFATSGKCARSIVQVVGDMNFICRADCSKFPQVRCLINKHGRGGVILILNSHFKFSILINKLGHLQATVGQITNTPKRELIKTNRSDGKIKLEFCNGSLEIQLMFSCFSFVLLHYL